MHHRHAVVVQDLATQWTQGCTSEYAALQVRVFLPLLASEVGVHVFGIFCSFGFSRDRHCHGTGKCPHRLSSDELLRVAVPSQLRVSLHAWRLPGRFKTASELCRRCSTPQHATRRTTHIHANISNKHTNTTKTITHQPQHGGGRRRRCACPCRR